MLYYHLCLVSLAFLFPAQIVAQCSACTSYIAALKSCQKTSANVTQVGSTMDTDTVHCMCTSSSSYAEMNSCTGCTYSDSSLYEDLDALVLFAWTTTCDADEQYGDKQAAACWHSQPSDYVPCVSKTGGNTGGGSGTLSGGASSSATTLPQGYVCAPFAPRFAFWEMRL